ncbi:MAG: helix-hairpin-helix domain-containing protein [Planctomycetes bacterium]|nr:helix-hairpin-helix domain-containing protein [Planctomycetota bacterium]
MSKNRNRVLWVLLLLLGVSCVFRLLTSEWNRSQTIPKSTNFQREVLPNVINPNTASWASLARLPGVGKTLAKNIVSYREDYRNRNGQDKQPFRNGEDLAQVKRIGPVTVSQIENYLTFDVIARSDQRE